MFSHEGYLALRERAGIVDRSSRGVLRLTGADRRSYLHGLLSNDIVALEAGTGCYAALLTPQARMISDMRVLETGDEILLDLPNATLERVRDHLTQFIFSEDVTVEADSGAAMRCGIYGPAAAWTLAGALTGESTPPAAAISAADLDRMPMLSNVRAAFDGTRLLIVRSDDVGVAGFDLLLQSSGTGRLVEALTARGALRVPDDTAEVCRVEAGRPLFGVDMDEDTIPLEAGITDRAISLTKGCYVGQEVIIRVLHRGHGRVARRLVGIRLEPTGAVPPRGAVVNTGDREIGRVTSAVHSPSVGGPIALGYVRREFTEPGTTVTVGESGGQPGQVVRLPFV